MSAVPAGGGGLFRILAIVLIPAWLAGCGSGDASREERSGPTGADSVEAAVRVYDPAAFDTVEWESRQAEMERGAVVWRISCTKCHGRTGAGDGGFVTRGDTLRPPSFLEPDWRLAGDEEALHEQIFTGTAEGMPHWGLVGLTYRDIDAVATFILEGVRAGVEGR